MRRLVAAGLLLIGLAGPASAHHRPRPSPGSLVGVAVEVEGASVPLYPARDRSGRYYVEAHRGARYAVRLDNRTGERLAVLMAVDGLNVITGERQPPGAQGRMYVLDPWESALIQGWRTSLDGVRRFTFVDERRSYAARSGRANAKMGWIELAVFRERHRAWPPDEPAITPEGRGSRRRDREPPADQAPPEARQERPPAAAPEPGSAGEGDALGRGRPKSFPGTGWGEPAHDPVSVVDFEAEARPAERITLRYEYAPALRALGVLPWPHGRDRLQERDRGDGFARPPRW